MGRPRACREAAARAASREAAPLVAGQPDARRARAAVPRAALALLAAVAALAAPAPLGAVERLKPREITLKTHLDAHLPVYLYLPQPASGGPGKAAGQPGAGPSVATPVIFLSGDWGWRPLQQDTASYLVTQGRPVLGLDATMYFHKPSERDGLREDLETFKAFVNERAGRPKDAAVILMGFGYGAEMIPYLLNRASAERVRGVLLIAPDKDGASVFRVAVQLKMPVPEAEAFQVGEELKRLPPDLPVALLQGAQDEAAQARALHALLRGPRRLLIVPGGDHQFKAVRPAYFEQVDQALRWIDGGPVQ